MTLWSPQDEKTFQDLQVKRRLAEDARNSRIDALLAHTTPQGVHRHGSSALKVWLTHHADDIVEALLPFCTRQGREER